MGRLIWTAVVVLFVVWLLLFALRVAGGLVHLLLVLAIILVLLRIIRGRPPV